MKFRWRLCHIQVTDLEESLDSVPSVPSVSSVVIFCFEFMIY